MAQELVKKTDLNRKKGKIYFIDQDGDICEGPMCGIIQRNPTKYQGGEKILKLGIKRESGYLYLVGKDGNIYREGK